MSADGSKIKPTRIRFQRDPELLNIPSRFASAKIEIITHEGLKQFAQHYVQDFTTFFRQGRAPAFFGKPGLGKSYVAAAIANELANGKLGVPVFWADTVDVLYRLIDYRDLHRAEEYFRLRRTLLETPLVVLDDFGQLRDFSRIRELFFLVVNKRYSQNLPTVFTANFGLGADGKDWASVDQCFNSALTRRIRMMSQGLVFCG